MPTLTADQVQEEAAHRLAQRRMQQRAIAEGNPLWPLGGRDATSRRIQEDCRFNSRLFHDVFFPDMCTDPWTDMHLDFFRQADEAARDTVRGLRDATAAPRGSAKTSTKGKGIPIWEGLYLYEDYTLIGSATRDMARDKTKDIRDVFDTHQRLREVYGPQETAQWRMVDFQLQTGCIYRAFTPRTAIRGLLRQNKRPSKIILDDAEDRETVLTPLRRQRFMDWYNMEVAKLGTKDTNIDVIGTIIHPDSLLASLLVNPGYHARLYQSVLSFADTPDAWELWRQWRLLVLDLANPNRLLDAQTFYEDHAEVMLHGVEVLWPSRKSYYSLMLSRLTESETAFWSEEQNAPNKDESYLFDLAQIATVRLTPAGVIRQDGKLVRYAEMDAFVAFLDPTPGVQKLTADWAACPVVCQDRHGYQYCVDAYLSQLDSQDAQLDGVVDVCCRWHVAKLGIESNGFQAGLVDILHQKFAARAKEEGSTYAPMLVPVKHSGARNNKTVRIRALQSPLHNHWLQLAESLPHEAWQQLSNFTVLTTENVDDYPDSLAAARAMLLMGET
ncbi:MAG TPA: hypothetical protein VI542_07375 [Candidatus Tectomicrobia bacterium]